MSDDPPAWKVAYYSGTVYAAWRGGFAYSSSFDDALKVACEHVGRGVLTTKGPAGAARRSPHAEQRGGGYCKYRMTAATRFISAEARCKTVSHDTRFGRLVLQSSSTSFTSSLSTETG
jgi:hypothetical protein